MPVLFDVPETLVGIRRKNRQKEEDKSKKEPRFNVILWNDDVHTFEYVIIMLHTLFGYPVEKGFQLAKEVHFRGRAVIFTSSLGEAELKRDQILGFGPDILLAESQGSIIATLEKVVDD